jgi:hypothetical protein
MPGEKYIYLKAICAYVFLTEYLRCTQKLCASFAHLYDNVYIIYVKGIRAEKPVLHSKEIIYARGKPHLYPIIIAHSY